MDDLMVRLASAMEVNLCRNKVKAHYTNPHNIYKNSINHESMKDIK